MTKDFNPEDEGLVDEIIHLADELQERMPDCPREAALRYAAQAFYEAIQKERTSRIVNKAQWN